MVDEKRCGVTDEERKKVRVSYAWGSRRTESGRRLQQAPATR